MTDPDAATVQLFEHEERHQRLRDIQQVARDNSHVDSFTSNAGAAVMHLQSTLRLIDTMLDGLITHELLERADAAHVAEIVAAARTTK